MKLETNDKKKSLPSLLNFNLQIYRVNNKMYLLIEVDENNLPNDVKRLLDKHIDDKCDAEHSEKNYQHDSQFQGNNEKPSRFNPDRKAALTKTEVEVLEKIALDWDNKKIADFYGKKESTVKCQVTSILMKLGVKNRYKAALVHGRLFGTSN